MKLTGQELTEQQNRYASVFLHSLSDFERITDHARNIAENASEIHEKQIVFSEEAKKELSVMVDAINEILSLTLEAFLREAEVESKKVEPLADVLDDLSDTLKMHTVARMENGQCTIANGFVFNDLVTNFERISDHCSNVALAIIEMHSEYYAGHEYIDRVKEKRLPDFERTYEHYREKFSIQ